VVQHQNGKWETIIFATYQMWTICAIAIVAVANTTTYVSGWTAIEPDALNRREALSRAGGLLYGGITTSTLSVPKIANAMRLLPSPPFSVTTNLLLTRLCLMKAGQYFRHHFYLQSMIGRRIVILLEETLGH
jgi:hypothetical protein